MYLIMEERNKGDFLARDSGKVLTALKINLETTHALVEKSSVFKNLI